MIYVKIQEGAQREIDLNVTADCKVLEAFGERAQRERLGSCDPIPGFSFSGALGKRIACPAKP